MASLAEPLQGGPYPDPDDDNDIPNDLRQIVEWAAERSVMRFTDEAERDSLLPTPTEGQLCVTDQGTALRVWVYANSDWREVMVGSIPGGRLTATGSQTIPNATVTTVTLGNVATLRGGMTVGSNGLVIPRDGWYTITGSIRWTSSNAGTRQMRLYNNNVIMVSDGLNAEGASRGITQVATVSWYCEMGDEISLSCYQSSGGNLDTSYSTTWNAPHLSVVWNGA